MSKAKSQTKFKVIFNGLDQVHLDVLSDQVIKVSPFSLFPLDRTVSQIHSTVYIFFEEDVEGKVGRALEQAYKQQNVNVVLQVLDADEKVIETINFGRTVLKDVRIGGFDYNDSDWGDFDAGTILNRASFRYNKLTRTYTN
jgi:hypothetical protein